jgi:PAS domain S-box-containing protein
MTHLGKEPEASLAAMIANTSVAFIVSNPRLPDNPIVMCNDAFIELTGYDRIEVLGRNCRFLTGKDTEPEQTQVIANAIHNRQPVLAQLTNYKRDGSPFRNAVMIAPSFDDTGQLAFFLGSQMEIANEIHQASSARQTLAIEVMKRLSPQQKRVLTQVTKGYMNKQIAHILHISESTVKKHRATALAKMRLSTTAEAIRVTVEAGN